MSADGGGATGYSSRMSAWSYCIVELGCYNAELKYTASREDWCRFLAHDWVAVYKSSQLAFRMDLKPSAPGAFCAKQFSCVDRVFLLAVTQCVFPDPLAQSGRQWIKGKGLTVYI